MSELFRAIEAEYTAHSSEPFPVRIADYVPIDTEEIARLQDVGVGSLQAQNAHYANQVRRDFLRFTHDWTLGYHPGDIAWRNNKEYIPLVELSRPDNRNHTHLIARILPRGFWGMFILEAAGNRMPRNIDEVRYDLFPYPRKPRDTEQGRAKAIKDFRKVQVAEWFLAEVMKTAVATVESPQ